MTHPPPPLPREGGELLFRQSLMTTRGYDPCKQVSRPDGLAMEGTYQEHAVEIPYHCHSNTQVGPELIISESVTCANSVFVDASSVDEFRLLSLLLFGFGIVRYPKVILKLIFNLHPPLFV